MNTHPIPLQYVEALEEIARKRGWTQQQLADMIGCRFETVNRWMTGAFLPSKSYMRIIKHFVYKETKKLVDEGYL